MRPVDAVQEVIHEITRIRTKTFRMISWIVLLLSFKYFSNRFAPSSPGHAGSARPPRARRRSRRVQRLYSGPPAVLRVLHQRPQSPVSERRISGISLRSSPMNATCSSPTPAKRKSSSNFAICLLNPVEQSPSSTPERGVQQPLSAPGDDSGFKPARRHNSKPRPSRALNISARRRFQQEQTTIVSTPSSPINKEFDPRGTPFD